MPQTPRDVGPWLAIQLADPPLPYAPGEVISGTVVRKQRLVTARGWVTICLLGRCKTKTRSRRSNNSHDTHCGRYNLFQLGTTTQKLYDGPMHVVSGGETASWPFSITVPDHADPVSVVAGGNVRSHTLVSLQRDDVVRHPLPATFEASYQGFGSEYEGFVEYWLEAQLHQEGEGTRVVKSTLPIRIRPMSTLTPIANFKRQNRNYHATISTLRLIPGLETAGLSFKQKTQEFFGSSKVPSFSFKFQVSAPTVIQLEHPVPIPFAVRLISKLHMMSEIVRNHPPTVYVQSLHMELRSSVFLVCPSHSGRDRHTEANKRTRDLGVRNFFNDLKRAGPVIVPQGVDPDFLDIGERLELRIDAQRVRANGQSVFNFPGGQPLYPTFTTYNIQHDHVLGWEMVLAIADQTYKVQGSLKLEILPPSEEQEAIKMMLAGRQPTIVPHDDAPLYEAVVGEEEQLPSYEEANKQGDYRTASHGSTSAEQPAYSQGTNRQSVETASDDIGVGQA